MKRIDSNARTIRELLANTKYQLDYYQREYSWQIKHVTELLDDLSRKFLESYTAGDTLTDVSSRYEHYFLGSIIISYSGSQRYIVDGQQRLTTLTLLLIWLYQALEDGPLKNQVEQCIYSLSGGTEGFNLDVEDWRDIMQALYKSKPFDEGGHLESIRNIALRYSDIEDYFEIEGEVLSCFAYWLLDNVYLVEIAAFDSKDAYAIFETVNDRGLSLTPADMLRGYLLSNIEDTDRRNRASEIWRKQVQSLRDIDKEEDTDAIKAWLRSQYAESVQDFERIGSEFHRWVHDHEKALNLVPNGFEEFIECDFKFYSDWYHRLRLAGKVLTPGLEYIYYNAQNNFTLQYPVLLAPLRVEDTKEDIYNKIRITATYLDILIHRRIWNFQEIAQRSMADPMFSVMHAIRGTSINKLSEILHTRLELQTRPFSDNRLFYFRNGYRRKIFLILARMTDYVGVQSGESSRYLEYVRTGRNSYEIEHIWANHLEYHVDEFSHESEFEAYRNRIGGLLLLPKSDNTSSGDDPYNKKLGVYSGQNLLAKSLHEQTYSNNPGFRKFREARGLEFKPHPEFKKADLDARQELYLKLAEQIWNPDRLRPEHRTENLPENLGDGGVDTGAAVKESFNANDGVETLNEGDESPPSDAEEMSAIEVIKGEIREFYRTRSHTAIDELCTRIEVLQNLIKEKGWDELTFKNRKFYCGFYLGTRPLFGASLYKNHSQFVVWMDKKDVERLRSHCKFQYEPSTRLATCPKGTTIEELFPILEFVYGTHAN